MTDVIRAIAPAKVNLSLAVHGKRRDGYHALTSLVVFADVGDTLRFTPSRNFSLSVTGPMAPRIEGTNLIEMAVGELEALSPDFFSGAVALEKILPVGAGVGGGSSDVAAYLRIIRAANPSLVGVVDWSALALRLGADVPVCLTGRAAWMRGIGERVTPLASGQTPLNAVLVNPGIGVPTGPVFTTLAASEISDTRRDEDEPLPSHTLDIEYLSTLNNDLESPALKVAPEILAVRQALQSCERVRLVRMSGSGATYFGLFDSASDAEAAREKVQHEHPNWWVAAARLGDAPDDGTYAP